MVILQSCFKVKYNELIFHLSLVIPFVCMSSGGLYVMSCKCFKDFVFNLYLCNTGT